MLIVTNGDMAAERIRALGLDADVLPWRDVLHDGPVRPAPSLQAQSAARAGFLAAMSGRSEAEVAADMAARDALFLDRIGRSRVELWFEHDLYDQLQLVQILDAAAAAGRAVDLRIVQTDAHLTALDDAAFRALAGAAAPLPDTALAEAQAVWAAFTAPDPTALDRLSGAAFQLRHLGPALRRLIAEYPDAVTGLPASMAMAASFLMATPMTIAELFRETQAAEDAAFMGDRSFAILIDGIAQCPEPLLQSQSGGPLAPVAGGGREAFAQRATLTPFGLSVLTGARNQLDANGIDRWIGGVHLTTDACWARSAETGRLALA